MSTPRLEKRMPLERGGSLMADDADLKARDAIAKEYADACKRRGVVPGSRAANDVPELRALRERTVAALIGPDATTTPGKKGA